MALLKCYRRILRQLNGPAKLCLFSVLILSKSSFGVNVTVNFEEDYTVPDEEDTPSYPHFQLLPKAIFGSVKWKFSSTELYMARCNAEEDCDAAIRMICSGGRCVCKTGDLFFEWPKYGCFSKVHMFGQCEVSGQCVAMNPNTYCNPDNGRCTCSPNYFYNGRECSIRYDGSNLKAQEVYKAAVVAAACFIVAVVGIFVACIVRRSFCRRDQHLHQSASSREGGDVFTISDEIAALRAVDKPPSYEEVLQIERTFYGIPPPEYSAPRSVSSLAAFPPQPVNCAPSQADTFNLPYAPSYSPPAEIHSSAISESINNRCLKDLTQEEAQHTEEESRDTPQAGATNFLAAAEVLPAPTEEPGIDFQINADSSPPIPINPSQNVPSHYISHTPPPRLHRVHLTPATLSSSLPGSPNLSSFSSHIRVLNLPNPVRNELLKQNSLSSESDSPSHILSETQELAGGSAISDDNPRAGNSSTAASGHSEQGYDNLGFVSDMHM